MDMDRFSSLPEVCILEILSLTSPRDACRSSAISLEIKAVADSDALWERFLPPDYPQIISRSVSPVSFSTKKQLFRSLSDSPMLLDDGHLAFALEKNSGKKCFMLGARMLEIIWGSSPNFWEWISLPEARFPEVALLLSVCWLEIKGKFEVRLLSPNTTYVAYLVFKIAKKSGLDCLPAKALVRFVGECSAPGAEDEGDTVYLQMRMSRAVRRLANGRLPEKRKDGWMEILLGEFFTGEENSYQVEINLKEIWRGNWKSGLTVEGIELRPKLG